MCWFDIKSKKSYKHFEVDVFLEKIKIKEWDGKGLPNGQ
jgi:hypothetical protein